MSIQFSNNYPIPPELLFKAFTQRGFFEQRYAETEVDEYTIQRFSATANGFDIAIEITPPIHPPKGIPSAAKKLIPARQKIFYTALWTKGRGSTWSVNYCYDVQGKPIKIVGLRRLTSTAEGAYSEVEFRVESSLPLFGKILAELIEARVKHELAADERALQDHIEQLM